MASMRRPLSGSRSPASIRSRTSPIASRSSSARSNFSASRFCFIGAVSPSHTYLSLPESLSSHRATHSASGSHTISPHSPSGRGASGLRFSVTSSWAAPCFQRPRSGCSPRPIKIPLGSVM